jgi:hypothetical protein
MSNTQNRIINKLLVEASLSPQNTKVAAAICSGSKVLSMNINTHRNKYGDEVRCSGHGEIAVIHSLFPNAFRRRKKGRYVL